MEERYGASQVCSVGTYTALQPRAAIKDLSRLMGIDFSEANYTTSFLSTGDETCEDVFRCICSQPKVASFVHKHPEVINEMMIILGAPKAQSIHACATMIFPNQKDMYHWIPLRKQKDMLVSEWEGTEMDSAGFLKEDILGIKQLDKFQAILKLIKENYGKDVDIYNLPLDDEEVYKYFRKGWNGDVFHFGSSGLTSYCQEMQPKNIEDLIVAISIYRPGAMENGFHTEYVLRKNGSHKIEYFTGAENILDKTLGIFVYQEQIMQLCQELGGLSLVEADDVRKAMGKKKFSELEKFAEQFISNYVEKFGVTSEYAKEVWDAIGKSATYLFNRSHAVAYTLTGYICQWLKVHYPLEYWTVAFNNAKDEDWALYISEISETTGTSLEHPDINKSSVIVTSDSKTHKLYWSLPSIKEVGEKAANQIFEDREKNGEYFSFEEFYDRHSYKYSKVDKSVVEHLIMGGAFDSIENITQPVARYELIKKFRELNGKKYDVNKDLFAINQLKIKEDWWWLLQQKKISGFAFFDYKNLVDRYLSPKVSSNYKFIGFTKALDSDFYNGNYTNLSTGGIVHSMDVKNSKRGQYCKIILEQNYKFLNVTFFSDIYEEFEEFLTGIKGNILLLNGSIAWDNFNSCPYLLVKAESKLVALT